MAIHHVNCRTSASGLDNLSAITDAMSWLCGDAELLTVDRTTSYHGSEINLITAKVAKNRDIKAFFAKLKSGNYSDIRQNITDRIDFAGYTLRLASLNVAHADKFLSCHLLIIWV